MTTGITKGRRGKIKFTKMHGLGNDFIVIDCRRTVIKNLSGVVRNLADRRFGIGFDQALILAAPKRRGRIKDADFRMDVYNADGTRVEMCGNGIRCLARYIWNRGLKRKKCLAIETDAGIIRPEWAPGAMVRVDMGEPVLDAALIPTTSKKKGHVIARPIKAAGKTFKVTCVSMGNPHAVTFVKDVDKVDIVKYGPYIETDAFFPKRTNVEFVEVVNRRRIKMRVWERGAGETLACGTGACASAVAANLKGFTARSVSVILLGGTLKIQWAANGHVFMTGPAVEVFSGSIEI